MQKQQAYLQIRQMILHQILQNLMIDQEKDINNQGNNTK